MERRKLRLWWVVALFIERVILYGRIFGSFEGNVRFPRLSAKLKGRQVIKMPWQKCIFARASLSLGGNEPKIDAIY